MNTFSDFDLLPSLQKTLKEKGLRRPTEIQARIVPLLLARKSVVGISETGSGKTLAFALPLLHLLKNLENQYDPVMTENSPRAVVVVPTRELGEQVAKVLKTYTHDTRLRVRLALGGMALESSRRNVEGEFEIVLATPGRLVQLLQMDLIDLSDVRVLIIDEADQMLDQGFLPDTQAILNRCPEKVVLGLFSATVSPAVEELIQSAFSSAEIVRTAGSGQVVSSLETRNIEIQDGKRWPALEKLLAQKVDGGTLIFANTREQCDRIAKELTDKGYSCGIYRGEMDKQERRTNLKRFRSGQVKQLVCTDLAGRGLDIDGVARVINYHLPKQMENYLHRAGRTARAGRPGVVINFVTERDEPLMAELEGRKPRPRPATPAHRVQKGKAPGKPASKSHSTNKPARKPPGKPGAKPSPKTQAKGKDAGKGKAKANAGRTAKSPKRRR